MHVSVVRMCVCMTGVTAREHFDVCVFVLCVWVARLVSILFLGPLIIPPFQMENS